MVSSDAEEPGDCEWPDLREVAEMRRQGGCGGGGGRLAAPGGGRWLPGVGAAAGVAGGGLRPGTGWTQGPGLATTTGRNGKPWKSWKNRGGGGCQFDGLGAPGRFEESCAEHLTIEDEVWENSVDCHVGCLCQEQLGHTMSHPSCLSCTERLLWTFSIESQTGTHFILLTSVVFCVQGESVRVCDQQGSNTSKAVECFQLGIDLHLKPCVVTYTPVIDSFARGGRVRHSDPQSDAVGALWPLWPLWPPRRGGRAVFFGNAPWPPWPRNISARQLGR